ncbi:probable calcium-binding protein CML25 [Nymphaea colorata]|uniref:EF-hand domain-containing protein n=1 Tax=Nymphaea colorata TaxID=210225 RepID=A0A5K1FZY2_9MAGN|nr:probable calcium-binding protein CML25 [Nymphaea colorata]
MGFGSCLNRCKKSKSPQQQPPTAESSSSELPESYAKEMERVFRRFDANGDGKITWAELGWIMSSLGQQATAKELQEMVRQVDSDGDGSISLDEFIELNTKGVDSSVALDDMRGAFSLFDVDGNGFISCKELHKFLSKIGDSATMDECRKMIGGVDKDGDGLINFEEFKAMMMGRSSRSSG